jgi:DNA-binding NarL/FixJ family response regulator
MNDPIKLLLVDDQQLIREGTQSLVEKTGDMIVVGSVASGEDAINVVRESRPDVIVMDIMMAGMTGIEATRWIKEHDPTVKVLLLAMEISKEYVSAGINAGVNGYLAKDVDKDTLIEGIRTIHNGGRCFDAAIIKLVFEDFYSHEKLKKTVRKLPDELTKREFEVLGLVAAGKTNKELADLLFISVKTVDTHKSHIMEKLGLKNVSGLIKYAIKNKIISVGDF